MAEDGSIVFRVDADDKEAQKKLTQLRRDIEKTAKAVSSTEDKRNGIAEQLKTARAEAQKTAAEIQAIRDQMRENNAVLSGRAGSVDLEEFNARKQAQAEMTVELREQEKLYNRQQATVAKLETQEQTVEATLQRQTDQLRRQQAEAGAVERTLAQQSSAVLPKLKEATEAVTTSMKRGFRNILKWGFGIRSAFILMRRLRSAIVEGVKAFAEQDEETKKNINSLKASLSTLKASWGAAFAPVLNTVTPLLKTFISWLTAAANAVQMFFAVLGGKSTYKRAIANNEALADSYSGAGGAAADAEKQLMGFDQINKLNDNSSSGGGGGSSSATSFIDEEIPDGGIIHSLALSVKDVLFDWTDLNAEQIAEKAIAGLGGLLGASVGFIIGGVPGAIVGTLLGVMLGLLVDSLIFDHDGTISKSEIASMITAALYALCGGVIGFAIGGPAGAFIGATVGFGIFALVKGMELKNGSTDGRITEKIATALTVLAGGAIGFLVGGPAGAAVGAIIGLGVSCIIESVKFSLNDDGGRSKYRDGVTWFLCGILGMPTDQEIMQAFRDMAGGIADSCRTIKADIADMKQNISTQLASLHQAAAAKVEAMRTDATNKLETLRRTAAQKMGSIRTDISQKMASIRNDLANSWSNATQAVQQHLSNMWSTVTQRTSNIQSSLSTGWANAKSTVLNHVNDMWSGISNRFSNIWSSISNSVNNIRSLLNFSWSFPRPVMPHFNWSWQSVGGLLSIPTFWIDWYAKGGIFDKASVIGVGEDGKEAVVPLERNTGWIDTLADSILDKIAGSRIADYITGRPLPAFASGQMVPPRAVDRESSLSDADIDRLARALATVLSKNNSGGSHVDEFIVDGHVLARINKKYSTRSERSDGR